MGGFCCPVPPEPRFHWLLGSESEMRYRWHCENGPITADTIPGKNQVFTRASILFRPHIVRVPGFARNWMNWWRRRVLPPGPLRLFHAVYRHSRLPDALYISAIRLRLKERWRSGSPETVNSGPCANIMISCAMSSKPASKRATGPAPGRWSVFGYQMRFDLADGFPAAHHQEAASEVDHLRACCGSSRATPTSTT